MIIGLGVIMESSGRHWFSSLGELRHGYYRSCIVRSSMVSDTSLELVMASRAMPVFLF